MCVFPSPPGVVCCCSGVKLTHHCASLSLSLLPEVSEPPIPPLKSPNRSVWKRSVSLAAHYRRHPPNAGATSRFIAFRPVVLWRASVACTVDAIAQNCTSPQTPRLFLFGTRAPVSLLPQTFRTLFTVCFAFELGGRLSSGRAEELVSQFLGLDAVLGPP